MTANPPLSFPLATGRMITDTSEIDWSQYTYWVESNGPLVVISEQQRLVAYLADDPAVSVVPEPTYALMAAFLLVLAIVIRWRFR